MPLIGPSFFILGLVVASVAVEQTSTDTVFTAPREFDDPFLGSNGNVSTTATPSTITDITSTNIASTTTNITSTTTATNTTINIFTSIMNITDRTMIPSTTKKGANGRLEESVTPKPFGPNKRTTAGTTTNKPMDRRTSQPQQPASDNTGIIILVVIILVALGFGVACYFARKRGRRYSVDLNSRPDEANIPLSTMEPELHIDTVPQNGLQTFERVETTAKEPQEPEAKPEVQEEQKAEADKSVVDPGAESAAPASSPDSSEDKPKEDVVEQSPPAPVEPSVEEKTDDEGVVSTKTSVESLKETNENNSSNADVSQKRDLKSSDLFWNVPLHCPV